MSQPTNTTQAAAQAAVSAALSGSGGKSGASDAVGAAMGATPYGAYAQAAGAALQGLGQLAGGGGPVGGANVSTPNFNNGPTAIISFGSGSVNSTANPTNTQTPSTGTGQASPIASAIGGVSSAFQYALLALGAVLIYKVAKRKAV